MAVQVHDPPDVQLHPDFAVKAKGKYDEKWLPVAAYAVDVANANITRNDFDKRTVAVASFDFGSPVQVRVSCGKTVHSAAIRPKSLGIKTHLHDNTILFSLDTPKDVMLELNNNKWTALHVLTNKIEPASILDNIWYFGPGINQGTVCPPTDGVNLLIPSNKTVYLAPGAFITYRLNFLDVSNSAVRGHGFILSPQGGYLVREHGGAILISNASNIHIEGVTSLSANGFSLCVGNSNNVHINRYRSFSSAGNGDGVDIFCSSAVVIENCFLRNSDDTIALYSHRWIWAGDSSDILIQGCVLLPDIAHAVNVGTHGNPENPETISNVVIRDVDVLDHDENQVWYQGCIAIDAADGNLVRDVVVEDVRVERITRGQLLNLRVMQNARWTTAPGRGIQNVAIRRLDLNMEDSKVVHPSMVLGFDSLRRVENVVVEDLVVGRIIHDAMDKPSWYTTADQVPMFINEHAGVRFVKSDNAI